MVAGEIELQSRATVTVVGDICVRDFSYLEVVQPLGMKAVVVHIAWRRLTPLDGDDIRIRPGLNLPRLGLDLARLWLDSVARLALFGPCRGGLLLCTSRWRLAGLIQRRRPRASSQSLM